MSTEKQPWEPHTESEPIRLVIDKRKKSERINKIKRKRSKKNVRTQQ